MIQPAILQKLETLPESLQTEVLHYIEFLLEKHHAQGKTSEVQPKQLQLANSIEGTFSLPLPEDIDSSSELMGDAAKGSYEEKYGYGSLAGKVTISDDFDEPLEDLKDYM
ncbi:MAG: DUF2281 domain-containing protein [Leptolyngbyaceae cyanobacterium]